MAFSMDLPDVEEVKNEVKEEIAPAPETKMQLEKAAESNTDELFTFDLGSLSDRRNIVSSIETFGSDVVAKSTQKNELLNVRLGGFNRDKSALMAEIISE